MAQVFSFEQARRAKESRDLRFPGIAIKAAPKRRMKKAEKAFEVRQHGKAWL